MSNQDNSNTQDLQAKIQELEAKLAALGGSGQATENKGIGKYVTENLTSPEWKDLTDKQIAKLVSEKFNSKTTAACIAWYKTKQRKALKAELEALAAQQEADQE